MCHVVTSQQKINVRNTAIQPISAEFDEHFSRVFLFVCFLINRWTLIYSRTKMKMNIGHLIYIMYKYTTERLAAQS